MDCKQTNELLNAYVDKELSKSDQTCLDSHLADCPSCRAELEDIRRLDAHMRADVQAPAHLRSMIADKLEAGRTASPRVSLKEMLGMRFRIGFAAIVAAGLIVVGVMSTGGNAQAAYLKMKKAVTAVTSAHLHLEFAPDAAKHISSDMKSDGDKDDDMVAQAIQGLASGQDAASVDVWSEGDKFRVSAFKGIDVACKDGYVTVMFGDKVFAHVKADEDDMHLPKNLAQELFNEFSKMQDELKSQGYTVVNRGSVSENGRTLDTLEVSGKDDDNKNFRLMYWIDQSTNLPARFQVFGGDQQALICTITCDYNEDYPDSLFEPGGKEQP